MVYLSRLSSFSENSVATEVLHVNLSNRTINKFLDFRDKAEKSSDSYLVDDPRPALLVVAPKFVLKILPDGPTLSGARMMRMP